MPQDTFKPRGPTKSSRPDAGGTNARSTPTFGIVKDNIDPTRSGRLQVYLSDYGGDDPDNRDNWVSVAYMTPFFGSTKPSGSETGLGSYADNPSSYGMWFAQPDIGTTVICIFINGDLNYGFWIGCVPQPDELTMIPAIGATENIIPNSGEANSYGGATRLPVTNINTNNSSVADSNNFIKEAKPIHSFQASIMAQQGILRDTIRGPISSSAQRETPSRVGWGISTPGRPIYTGKYTDESLAQALNSGSGPSDQNLQVIARRGGHSIVMDDGDLIGQDQLIRIRTALGHQILMSDNGQTLMILHSNGQSYIELGKEGTVDIYSTNSINLRTQGDLNFHADRNINIHAAKELNLQAENIKVNSEQEITTRSGTNTKVYSLGNYTLKADAAMSFASIADGSFLSEALTFINGSKINLNTGSSSTVPNKIKPIPIVAHTDTLHDTSKGFVAAPGKLMSITSRAPAHAPWANAGQGVDVKVSLGAADNLPPAPSSSIQQTNKLASELPSASQNPAASIPTAVTMPYTKAVSGELDENVTAAMLAQSATIAANSVSPVGSNNTGFNLTLPSASTSVGSANIGIYAQTAAQMVSAGVLKPGADKIIREMLNNSSLTGIRPGTTDPSFLKLDFLSFDVKNNLTAITNVSKLFPPTLFTGKPGAETINSYMNNVVSQSVAQVTNFTKAQSALTIGKAIRGNETAGQLAGLVLSGAQVGLSATQAAIAIGAASGSLPAQGTSAFNSFKAINSGINAVNVAQNITGGLGGIVKSINALDKGAGTIPSLDNILQSTKGVAASAFYGIVNQYKPMIPNRPQNLKTIANLNQALVNSLSAGISTLSTGLASKASVYASGLTNLPGGQQTVQSVINLGKNAINSLPGTASLASQANQAFQNIVTKAKDSQFPTVPGINQLGGILTNTSTGLSAGASAALESAVAALSSGGSVPIKLPTIGFQTTDRSSLETQITSVLGDDRIPPPIFTGEISSTAISNLEAQATKVAGQLVLAEDYQSKLKDIVGLKEKYFQLERTELPNSSILANAKKAWFDAVKTAEGVASQLDTDRG